MRCGAKRSRTGAGTGAASDDPPAALVLGASPQIGATTISTSADKSDFGRAMPSTDTCPRCHGDGILRHRSKGANDCPHCGGLGRLVSVTSVSNNAAMPDSLKAMIWPYTIHLRPPQRELFAGTVLTLLQELPPGTIGPGTVAQACRTAQRQVLRREVHHGARPGGARF
jgi:hypothetical protein